MLLMHWDPGRKRVVQVVVVLHEMASAVLARNITNVILESTCHSRAHEEDVKGDFIVF